MATRDREPAPDYRTYELRPGVRVAVMPVRLPPSWTGPNAIAIRCHVNLATGEITPETVVLMDADQEM